MKTWSALCLLVPALSLAAQSNLVSGWSPASNKVSFRILCPDSLTAGGKDNFFWVKCEIKNEGGDALWISNRARLFLIDDLGHTQRCLRRTITGKGPGQPGFDYCRLLGTHQTTLWWESGQLGKAEQYRLQAALDDLGIQTPPVRVNIALSTTADEEETRVTALQECFDGFPLLIPNAGEPVGTYHWVGFTGDPVVIDGELYYAFRFKAPEKPRNLVWSFICEDRSMGHWYIVPRKNRMEGFRRFDRVAGENGVLGLINIKGS